MVSGAAWLRPWDERSRLKEEVSANQGFEIKHIFTSMLFLTW